MLPIAGVHMKVGIFTRNPVPYGMFKDTAVDKRHSEYRGSWQRGGKRVVEPDDSDTLQLYRIKKSNNCHTTTSATHIPSVHDHDTSRHNNAPMIHASLPFSHAFKLSCFTFVCLFYSLQLTWFADPALVTLVYPNRM